MTPHTIGFIFNQLYPTYTARPTGEKRCTNFLISREQVELSVK